MPSLSSWAPSVRPRGPLSCLIWADKKSVGVQVSDAGGTEHWGGRASVLVGGREVEANIMDPDVGLSILWSFDPLQVVKWSGTFHFHKGSFQKPRVKECGVEDTFSISILTDLWRRTMVEKNGWNSPPAVGKLGPRRVENGTSPVENSSSSGSTDMRAE